MTNTSTPVTADVRRPARAGTIVWGLMLLTVAVFGLLAARSVIASTPLLVILVSAGGGILLMVLAIVAASIRATLRQTRELAQSEDPAPTDVSQKSPEAHQPVD